MSKIIIITIGLLSLIGSAQMQQLPLGLGNMLGGGGGSNQQAGPGQMLGNLLGGGGSNQQAGPGQMLGNLPGGNSPQAGPGQMLGNLLGGGGGSNQQAGPGQMLGNLLGGGGSNQQAGPSQMLGNLPGGNSPQAGPGQMLGNLFGQNPINNGQSSGGLTDTLRRIPQRGMELINNLMNSVRNMLPGGANGMGRNGQLPIRNPLEQLSNSMQQGQLNMPNPFANGSNMLNNGQNPLGQLSRNLPNLNQLTAPVTDALSQGRMPDVNSLSQSAGNIAQGLTRTLSGVLPNGQNGGGVNGV